MIIYDIISYKGIAIKLYPVQAFLGLITPARPAPMCGAIA